jgi:ribosomal protein L16/L10AE
VGVAEELASEGLKLASAKLRLDTRVVKRLGE